MSATPSRPAPDGVTLRRARLDDAEGFAAMMNDPAVYPGVMQLPFTDVAFWRERLAESRGGPAQLDLQLAALHEGRVIGGAGLHSGAPLVRRRHAMYMGISVVGDWQGRGVGDLLLGALCQHADRWLGIVRIELTVFTDNDRAIALYRRHGFEMEGTMRAYALRDGQLVDVHQMARLRLPPSLTTGAA